jgi:hypothetical protein
MIVKCGAPVSRPTARSPMGLALTPALASHYADHNGRGLPPGEAYLLPLVVLSCGTRW